MQVLIIGGGVAGIATAIALRQQGMAVRVLERHPAATTIGAGIVAWPNASFVLEQLGVLPEMEAVGGRPRVMRRRSNTGDDLGSLDIADIDRRMGYPSLALLRTDFQSILLRRLADLGVQVEYGSAVARIVPGVSGISGRAQVLLDDGEVIDADVIVGADGRMASRARLYVHGANQPLYQGFINWIGVVESEHAMFDDSAVVDYWGKGERFGIVPVTPRKAYWAGGAASSELTAKDPARYKEELAALFAAWPEAVRRVIDATDSTRINKIHVHDHDPIRRWHRDNVIAIGDASHASLPTSGQGACQALEDGWHLANCLARTPGDVQRAFDAFTALRLEKTAAITMTGRALAASLFSRDEQACRRRDQASKGADFGALAAGMARGWSQHLPLALNP